MKTYIIFVLVFFLFFSGLQSIKAQVVMVSIPDSSAPSGADVTLPIKVSNLDGLGVISYLIIINFDQQIVDATSVEVSGTLTNDWGEPTVSDQEGRLTVASAGTSDLVGSGTLFYINFDVLGSAGEQTVISFELITFNEGQPTANPISGVFTVAGSEESVTFFVPDTAAPPNSVLEIPIRLSDVTGLEVISYIFTLNFDQQILDATGILITGTLAESWGAPTFSDSEGQITVASAGTTFLSGSGILIYLVFDVVGELGQQTPLILQDVLLNEGEPAVITVDGSFTVSEQGQSLNIFVPDTSAVTDTSIALPIYVGETSGLNVISYLLTLTYDPLVVAVTGVTVENSLTESWGLPTVSDQTGQLVVAGAGVQALSGAGVLVFVNFTVLGNAGQQTALTLTEVLFNEGSPTAIIDNGSLRINQRSGVKEFDPRDRAPENYILFQNYPNPFNAETVIKFSLVQPGRVKLSLYNTLGHRVCTLLETNSTRGDFQIRWDGTDDSGKVVASGEYFLIMNCDQFTTTNKLLFLK